MRAIPFVIRSFPMLLADTAFRRRKANAIFLGLGGLAKPISPPLIIIPAPGPIPLDNHFQWWSYVKGSNWRIVKASGSRSLTPQPRMTASLQNPDALAKKTSVNLDDCSVCSSSWRRESNAVSPLSMILKFFPANNRRSQTAGCRPRAAVEVPGNF